MVIYLKDMETRSIITIYTNVIYWSPDYIDIELNNLRSRKYCAENQYFTNIKEETNDRQD